MADMNVDAGEEAALQIGSFVFIRPIGIYSVIESVYVDANPRGKYSIRYHCEAIVYAPGWSASQLELAIDEEEEEEKASIN